MHHIRTRFFPVSSFPGRLEADRKRQVPMPFPIIPGLHCRGRKPSVCRIRSACLHSGEERGKQGTGRASPFCPIRPLLPGPHASPARHPVVPRKMGNTGAHTGFAFPWQYPVSCITPVSFYIPPYRRFLCLYCNLSPASGKTVCCPPRGVHGHISASPPARPFPLFLHAWGSSGMQDAGAVWGTPPVPCCLRLPCPRLCLLHISGSMYTHIHFLFPSWY